MFKEFEQNIRQLLPVFTFGSHSKKKQNLEVKITLPQ